jgi:hypothetical protein
MSSVRAIAYYLPEFHPIPENDKWWGKGFTEWTNVARSKPLFKGHKQPHYPADLGYYDLRVSEIRELQAELAFNSGIEGFCYWHYWFGNGERLLERPFEEVLKSGSPHFPFCLAWANESWSGIWHGAKDRVLIRQEYFGFRDFENHFYNLLPAFLDKRYIRVDNKPLFIIYNPEGLPDMCEFTEYFNNLAVKNGLDGIFIVANNVKNNIFDWNPVKYGFDAYTVSAHNRISHAKPESEFYRAKLLERKSLKNKTIRKIRKLLSIQPENDGQIPRHVYDYSEAAKFFLMDNPYDIDLFPTAITGWDNSPRSGINSLILTGYNPDAFRLHIKEALVAASKTEHKIMFVKSWNEWAEGNYLEPELEFGCQFLKVLKEELSFSL